MQGGDDALMQRRSEVDEQIAAGNKVEFGEV
jgi:hypothetical protein